MVHIFLVYGEGVPFLKNADEVKVFGGSDLSGTGEALGCSRPPVLCCWIASFIVANQSHDAGSSAGSMFGPDCIGEVRTTDRFIFLNADKRLKGTLRDLLGTEGWVNYCEHVLQNVNVRGDFLLPILLMACVFILPEVSNNDGHFHKGD